MNNDKWEYTTVSGLQTFNLKETMNNLGKEGWEAVNVSFTGDVMVLLFKRKIYES